VLGEKNSMKVLASMYQEKYGGDTPPIVIKGTAVDTEKTAKVFNCILKKLITTNSGRI
jgi:hypothetical protein